MKKYLLTLFAAATVSSLLAIPARRQRVTVTDPDGTTHVVLYLADEFGATYLDAMGQHLRRDAEGYWRPLSATDVEIQETNVRRMKAARKPASSFHAPSLGEHHVPVLLVQFPDLKFTEGDSITHFEAMLNGDNYTYNGATGSAKKYFTDQSMGQYVPTFDIIGPVTVSQPYAYYGGNNKSGSDKRPQEMVSEGLQLAIQNKLLTDASPYDNDGDGFVDLVFVFYAGYSESSYGADAGGEDYIWAHQWYTATPITLNGISFSRYSCSSELWGTASDATKTFDGIGSFVHETSHGLGLPDFYNTGDSVGCYGMDQWSVMDQGCYNNNGMTPPNYTAFERQSLGWLTPDTLPAQGAYTLEDIGKSNHAYVYYNPSNPDEAFYFENHQPTGWDAYWGGYSGSLHGMLITHLDYDAMVWEDDAVNNSPKHQRYTVVPADGDLYPYDRVVSNSTYYNYLTSFRNDIWNGTNGATSFSARTTPAARFYTGDTATFVMHDIQEKNGVIQFTVESVQDTTDETALARVSTDAAETSRYVDVYDLNGRRLLSGVERDGFMQRCPLPSGCYLLFDGKLSRRIFINPHQ
jgi:M6 family metalloprotease-like protein